MSIEKEVVLQLKIQKPRDSGAWADVQRQVEGVRQGLAHAGEASNKAMTEMAAQQKRLQAELTTSKAGVTALAREIGRGAKEAKAIEGLTAQLRGLGVAAKPAEQAAARLFQQIGAGARVAQADVQRLATALRATAGAGGSRGGFLSMPIGGLSVGGVGLLGLGRQAGAGLMQAGRQALMTPGDQQIQETLRNRQFGGSASQSFWANAVNSMPGGETLRDVFTINQRQGATDAQRRLAIQIQAGERRRQEQQTRTGGMLAVSAANQEGLRSSGMAGITARGGFMAAQEQTRAFQGDRRFDALQQRFQLEMEAAGRGEGVGRGSLAALRGEIGNRPQFGQAQRFQLGQERGLAQQEFAEAQRRGAGATGPGAEMQRVAAMEQMRAARERLLDIEQRGVEVTRQAAEAEQQRLERFRQFAQQAEQSYRQIAQHERDRISTFREQFGLMDELEQMEVRRLSERAAMQGGRGIQRLSSQELRQLQSTGLFDEQVRGEAGRRAERSGIQGIIQASGAEGRVSQAEARQREAAQIRTQVEQSITVNMQASAQDIARQIATQLQPAIAALTQQTVTLLNRTIANALAEAERLRALQNSQNGQ